MCNLELNSSTCCFDGGDCALVDSAGRNDDWQSQFDLTLNGFIRDNLVEIGNLLCPGCEELVGQNNGTWLGDHVCNPNLASEVDCCFYGGDCIMEKEPPNGCFPDLLRGNQRERGCEIADEQSPCPTCQSNNLTQLDDMVCNPSIRNDSSCCFDSLDCHLCSTCPCPSVVGDHFCDMNLFSEASCCLDGGDCNSDLKGRMLCPSCSFEKYRSNIGDGSCQIELANLGCCFDGGDCLATLENSLNWCSSCTSKSQTITYEVYLSNGICEGHYNRSDCCFDGGDCLDKQQLELCQSCLLDHSQAYIANRRCDSIFNSLECCFDGGFCEVDVCSTCLDEKLKLRINDGICDEIIMKLTDCCQDRDDCRDDVILVNNACHSCQVSGAHAFLGTGQCDPFMNSYQCCFDGGDCEALTCRDCEFFPQHLTIGAKFI